MVKLVVVKHGRKFKAHLLMDRDALGKLCDSTADLLNGDADSAKFSGVEMNIDGESEHGSLDVELLDE